MPIVDTWDEEKLKEMFNSVNGIIFPGGGQVVHLFCSLLAK